MCLSACETIIQSETMNECFISAGFTAVVPVPVFERVSEQGGAAWPGLSSWFGKKPPSFLKGLAGELGPEREAGASEEQDCPTKHL